MTSFKTIFADDFDQSLLAAFEKVIDYNVRLAVLDENNHDLYLMITNIFSELGRLSSAKSRLLPAHCYKDLQFLKKKVYAV